MYLRAASISLRISHTCGRPLLGVDVLAELHGFQSGIACQWSGVATSTASKDLPAFSYISR
jgi:hypothetical protein